MERSLASLKACVINRIPSHAFAHYYAADAYHLLGQEENAQRECGAYVNRMEATVRSAGMGGKLLTVHALSVRVG